MVVTRDIGIIFGIFFGLAPAALAGGAGVVWLIKRITVLRDSQRGHRVIEEWRWSPDEGVPEEWDEIPTVKDVGYNTYIRSDVWKAKSAFMKREADYRCGICDSRGPLEAHHTTYERLGEEELEDLWVVCRSCHMFLHRERKGQ